MRLRGVDFGKVWGASGVQGFFGEGYWFHKPWRRLGLDFRGLTFVAKTTTLHRRDGNLPLDGACEPRERFPRCIVVKPIPGAVLNAVGLSGPGVKELLSDGRWQLRSEPFFLSFMSVQSTAEERLLELQAFVRLFQRYLPHFQAPVGLQINYSCPNVGLHPEALAAETREGLAAAKTLGIPLVPKYNVLLPPAAAAEIAADPNCDALCVSNTVPWGTFPDRIDWRGIFGSETSPLAALGGGGLSGRPLLPLVIDWLKAAILAGVRKPVNLGGGILHPDDVVQVRKAGAASVFIGSQAILRPWRVQRTIRRANWLDWPSR